MLKLTQPAADNAMVEFYQPRPPPTSHHPHNTADCELITNRAAESGESVCHIFYSARMIVNKRSG